MNPVLAATGISLIVLSPSLAVPRHVEDLCFYQAGQISWHCQTNLSGPAKGAGLRCSGCELTPLGQGGRTVLFEDVAAVEVTVVVEVVVD